MSISKSERTDMSISNFHTSENDVTMVSTKEIIKPSDMKTETNSIVKTSDMDPAIARNPIETLIWKSDVGMVFDDFSLTRSNWQDNQNPHSTDPLSISPCSPLNTVMNDNITHISENTSINPVLHIEKERFLTTIEEVSDVPYTPRGKCTAYFESDMDGKDCNVASEINFTGITTLERSISTVPFVKSTIAVTHSVDNEPKYLKKIPVECNASLVIDNAPKDYGGLLVDCNAPNSVENKPKDIGGLNGHCNAPNIVQNKPKDFGGLHVDRNAPHNEENKPKEFGGLPVYSSAPHVVDIDQKDFEVPSSVDNEASYILHNLPKNYEGLSVDINVSYDKDKTVRDIRKSSDDCDAPNVIGYKTMNFRGLSGDYNTPHVKDKKQKDFEGLSVERSTSHVIDNKIKDFEALPVTSSSSHVIFNQTAPYHSMEETKLPAFPYKSSKTDDSDISFECSSDTYKNILEFPIAQKCSFIGDPTSKSNLSTETFEKITIPRIHDAKNVLNDSRELKVNRIVSCDSTSLLQESDNDQYKEKLMEKITSELSHKDIHQLVIKAIEDGKYKQTVIPIDIWDFGGQKDYHMTHQLFITSRGIFVLIFNGSRGIHKTRRDLAYLPGHFGRPTVAGLF